MTLFLPVTNSNSVDPSCVAMCARALCEKRPSMRVDLYIYPKSAQNFQSHVWPQCLSWSGHRRIQLAMAPKDHVKPAPLVGFGRDCLALATARNYLTDNAHKQIQPYPLLEWSPPEYTAVATHSDQPATNFSANPIRYPCKH
jgi:hypothetical protein